MSFSIAHELTKIARANYQAESVAPPPIGQHQPAPVVQVHDWTTQARVDVYSAMVGAPTCFGIGHRQCGVGISWVTAAAAAATAEVWRWAAAVAANKQACKRL